MGFDGDRTGMVDGDYKWVAMEMVLTHRVRVTYILFLGVYFASVLFCLYIISSRFVCSGSLLWPTGKKGSSNNGLF